MPGSNSVGLLTLARDLRRRRARERQRLFVAEGIRATEELLRSSLRLRGVLLAPPLDATPRGVALRAQVAALGVPSLEVDDRELASAADTETSQGVLAIGEIPDRPLDALDLPLRARLLVLDAVQDPGNVGTLLRTAAAFGASATLALPGTVDLWNAKVVRSSMGALFHHPSSLCTWEALDAFRARHDLELWGADTGGEPPGVGTVPERVALAVGNEGSGLSLAARDRCARIISIPIEPGVESLNVAVAAGILLFELRP